MFSPQHYALQILSQVIKTRWKVLPREQCDGKRSLIFEFLEIFLIFHVLQIGFIAIKITLHPDCFFVGAGKRYTSPIPTLTYDHHEPMTTIQSVHMLFGARDGNT